MFVIQEDRLRTSTAEIKAAMDKITDISNRNVMQDGRDTDRLQYFIHALRIYEAEFSVQLKEWKRVSQIVEVLISSDLLRTSILTWSRYDLHRKWPIQAPWQ
jgi:hypothetical protein